MVFKDVLGSVFDLDLVVCKHYFNPFSDILHDAFGCCKILAEPCECLSSVLLPFLQFQAIFLNQSYVFWMTYSPTTSKLIVQDFVQSWNWIWNSHKYSFSHKPQEQTVKFPYSFVAKFNPVRICHNIDTELATNRILL